MLVLSRKINESITIDDDVKITVLGRYGASQIRIGISAPKKVRVHREEIYKKIQQKNQNALTESSNEDKVNAA